MKRDGVGSESISYEFGFAFLPFSQDRPNYSKVQYQRHTALQYSNNLEGCALTAATVARCRYVTRLYTHTTHMRRQDSDVSAPLGEC